MSQTTAPEPSPVDDPTASDPRSVVARYFRVWNDGDPATVDQLIGPDWVDHAHPERGAADVRQAIAELHLTQPDTRVMIDALLADGEMVTVYGRIERNQEIENRVWIVRVAGGRMLEMWSYCAD